MRVQGLVSGFVASLESQVQRLKIRKPKACNLQSAISRPQSLASGFTLLEVMVALAVLAIGIVTVMELFTGSLALGAKSSRYTQGVIYAQQVMDRLFAHTTLKDGEENGELPGGYVWLARVQEIRPDDDATQSTRFDSRRRNPIDFFHLKEIEVSVRWEENGAPQIYTLRSLRTVVEQPTE